MKNYVILLLIVSLIVSGCSQTTQNNTESNFEKQTKDYTFVRTITFSNENGTTIITQNKITKQAAIEMDAYVELETEMFDMTNLSTNMMCGIMATAFFNNTEGFKFDKEAKFNVTDDSPEEQKDNVTENFLEGYTITKVKLSLFDLPLKNKKSDCEITGSENVKINFY